MLSRMNLTVKASPLAVALLIALSMPGMAMAQDSATTPKKEEAKADAETTTAKKVGTVEVRGSSADEERRNSSVSKIIYKRDDILKQGDTSIFDVLKRLPGVSQGSRGGGPQLRGLGGGYTQILVDGQPQSSGFQLSQIAPEMIERIEIVPTATAEYSTRAVAGTINIVLRKNMSRSQRKVSAYGGYSPSQEMYGANTTLSNTNGKFGYTINFGVNRFNSDSESYSLQQRYNANDVLVQDRLSTTDYQARNTSFNNLTRLNWTLENGANLTAQSMLYAGKGKNTADTVYTNSVGTLNTPFPRLWAQSSTDFVGVRPGLEFTKTFGTSGTFSTTLNGQYDRNSTDTPFDGFSVSGARLIHRDWTLKNVATQWTSTGKVENTVYDKHKVSTGWEISRATREETRNQWDTPTGGATTYFYDRNNATVKRAAFFAQDEFALSKRMSLYAGARWEGSQTDMDGVLFGSFRNRTSVLSPIASMLYRLSDTERDQIRIGLARTYNPPNTNQLIPRAAPSIDGDNSPTSPLPTGNPALKPELSTGLDVAYENYFGKTGMFGVSAYYRHIDDAIANTISFQAPYWVSRPENTGKAKAFGLSSELKFPTRHFWAEGPDMDVRSSISRNWSKVTYWPSPYNVLAAQIPLTVTAGFDWRATPKLTIGTDASYNQGRISRTSDSSYQKTFSITSLDMYASYKFSPKLLARVSLNNLLPKDQHSYSYYNLASGRMFSDSWSDDYTTLRAMVEYKF